MAQYASLRNERFDRYLVSGRPDVEPSERREQCGMHGGGCRRMLHRVSIPQGWAVDGRGHAGTVHFCERALKGIWAAQVVGRRSVAGPQVYLGIDDAHSRRLYHIRALCTDM